MTKTEINRKIAELNRKLEAILVEEHSIKNSDYDSWIKDLLLSMLNQGLRDWPWQKLIAFDNNRKKINQEKQRLQFYLIPNKIGQITEKEIQYAKSVPIGDILGITNGKTQIKCPVHNDKHPSAKWYKNTNKLKCFACGFYGDSVDLIMKLCNLTFIDAVKKLINV